MMVFSQTRTEKAKILIREYFKENMNDYSSYSPVSYGKLDSLFTKIYDDESILSTYEWTMEAAKDANLTDVDVTYDLTEIIESMETRAHLYKEGAILKWKIYEGRRKILMEFIKLFTPEFIGWEITHKYRAKNQYNATILYNKEFRLNKGMTKITEIIDIE